MADAGSPTDKIRVVSNESRAEDIDTTSKYFADTHVEIQRYHDELRKGATLLIVPVTDANNREEIHQILKANGARMVTHFGEWVTEMMK